jgi:uncharacterized lipoprotein YddW (UPF0748 family)
VGVFWLLLWGCGAEEGVWRSPPVRPAPSGETGLDTGQGDGHADPGTTPGTTPSDDSWPTVPVGHRRELRGLWVASVWNIDFPSRSDLSPDAGRAELDALLDLAVDLGLNAVMLQVRPNGDALYQPGLEPWSRWLTGAEGTDPGWDPLAHLVAGAHARGLEAHAWFNPYRGGASTSHALSPDHLCARDPSACVVYGSLRWMDPGLPRVRAHTVAVAVDVASRYDIDGLILDDYFYPYPDGSEFPDSASYAAYQAEGGPLARDDWRRSNVNQLVAELDAGLRAVRDDLRFTISPFGIYRPGEPPGITGLDQYAAIFADPVAWAEAGTVDLLAPQLYWPTTQAAQAFEPLLQWWEALGARTGVWIASALSTSSAGSTAAWTSAEYEAQVGITRAGHPDVVAGHLLYNASSLLEDQSGVAGVFRGLNAAPALSPPLGRQRARAVQPPGVVALADGSGWQLAHRDAAPLRGWAVYREEGAGYVFEELLPPGLDVVPRGSARLAVSAVTRHGAESEGVILSPD